MQPASYQPGARYRIQATDNAHGMPVYVLTAGNQADAFTVGDGMRADPAHDGRTIEVVRQNKSRQGDPIRWRWHTSNAKWEPVGWNTDDARPRRRPAAGTV